jgi:hypothetical protein
MITPTREGNQRAPVVRDRRAENHHDVSIVDESGTQRVRLRIDDTAAGFARLMSVLGEQRAVSSEPITVAIETSKGLLPAALRAAGVALVAINPLGGARPS